MDPQLLYRHLASHPNSAAFEKMDLQKEFPVETPSPAPTLANGNPQITYSQTRTTSLAWPLPPVAPQPNSLPHDYFITVTEDALGKQKRACWPLLESQPQAATTFGGMRLLLTHFAHLHRRTAGSRKDMEPTPPYLFGFLVQS